MKNMADDCIEQFLCRIPKPKRPDHIAMPIVTTKLHAQKTSEPEARAESHVPTVQIMPPRPPVPPRRHTLAEICRYADEQCAYIEWMTRELEAEEAARRRSMPTTPIGAITNPFSGPADMWWRPTSANEMYGKSALRCQQEEEERMRMQHPYLAANGFPEFLETTRPKEEIIKPDTGAKTIIGGVGLAAPNRDLLEDHTGYLAERKPYSDAEEDNVSRFIKTSDGYDSRERRASLPSSIRSSHGSPSRGTLRLEQGSMIMMIPKALLCFLLLPLILTVGWCSTSLNEDEEM